MRNKEKTNTSRASKSPDQTMCVVNLHLFQRKNIWRNRAQIPRYYVALQTEGSVCCKLAAIHCSKGRSSST